MNKIKKALILAQKLYSGTWKYLIGSCITCFAVFLSKPLLSPLFIQSIFDKLEMGSMEGFVQLAVIACIVLLLTVGVSYFLIVFADAWRLLLSANGVENSLRLMYDIPFFVTEDSYGKEEQFNRITKGSAGPNNLAAIWSHVLASGLCAVVILTLLYDSAPLLFGAGVLLIIVEVLRIIYELRKGTTYQRELQQKAASLNGNIYSYMMHLEQLQFSPLQENAVNQFALCREEYWEKRKQLVRFQSTLSLLSDSFYTLLRSCIYGVLSSSASLSMGTFASADSFFSSFKGVVSESIAYAGDTSGCLTEIERLDALVGPGKVNHHPTMNLSAPVLELKGVSVERGGKQLVSDISFSVSQGEKIAIVGANGSGKTTCLKTILGEYLPTSGTVKLFGEDIFSVDHSVKEEFCGYAPVESMLFHCSARENIAMGSNSATPTNTSLLGDDQVLSRLPTQLSQGQKQRVNLLRALQKDPALLVFDEPTAGLDEVSSAAALDLILSQSSSVLVVTHDLNCLNRFDRVIVIEKGRMVSVETQAIPED